MRLFDAHCHLADEKGKSPSSSGPDSRVCGRLLCGVCPEGWARLADVAGKRPGSVAAFGVHPWFAGEASGDWLERLERHAAADPKAWIGEIGLDGSRAETPPPEAQAAVFSEQLRLAARVGRRVNLHCVKAWDELLRLLDRDYPVGGNGRGFVVHSFSGPHRAVRALADRGAYFSVGPLFSRRDSRRDRERAAILPEERLLLESDAFVTPDADAADDMGHALDWLAAVRNLPAAALADMIWENTRRLFGNG